MQNVDLNTWEEFEAQIVKLQTYRRELIASNAGSFIPDLIFRGHSDSKWKLETTLERFVGSGMGLMDYYHKIYISRSYIETFTNKQWDIKSLEDYEQFLETWHTRFDDGLPAYDYMVYLRHHGYPSPLLDWTASPYIAAFFAFNNVSKGSENVSIYVFLETRGSWKLFSGDKPAIHVRGPYVKSHGRHFLQQCRYTVCIQKAGVNSSYSFHEDVFLRNESNQDLLWKINIPATERIKALRKLNEMNINTYSLFGTEDALIDTVAKRELLIREH